MSTVCTTNPLLRTDKQRKRLERRTQCRMDRISRGLSPELWTDKIRQRFRSFVWYLKKLLYGTPGKRRTKRMNQWKTAVKEADIQAELEKRFREALRSQDSQKVKEAREDLNVWRGDTSTDRRSQLHKYLKVVD